MLCSCSVMENQLSVVPIVQTTIAENKRKIHSQVKEDSMPSRTSLTLKCDVIRQHDDDQGDSIKKERSHHSVLCSAETKCASPTWQCVASMEQINSATPQLCCWCAYTNSVKVKIS